RWIDTPFFANSRACGRDGGVDCVNLAAAIDERLGILHERLEWPRQLMDWGDHGDRSVLLEAFETWPVLRNRFARVVGAPLPADHLIFRGGRVPHHLAIMLGKDHFLQALKPDGVSRWELLSIVLGRAVLGELVAIYRPLQ